MRNYETFLTLGRCIRMRAWLPMVRSSFRGAANPRTMKLESEAVRSDQGAGVGEKKKQGFDGCVPD